MANGNGTGLASPYEICWEVRHKLALEVEGLLNDLSGRGLDGHQLAVTRLIGVKFPGLSIRKVQVSAPAFSVIVYEHPKYPAFITEFDIIE